MLPAPKSLTGSGTWRDGHNKRKKSFAEITATGVDPAVGQSFSLIPLSIPLLTLSPHPLSPHRLITASYRLFETSTSLPIIFPRPLFPMKTFNLSLGFIAGLVASSMAQDVSDSSDSSVPTTNSSTPLAINQTIATLAALTPDDVGGLNVTAAMISSVFGQYLLLTLSFSMLWPHCNL